MKGGIEACYSSVSCACALLGALDELSQGRGLQQDQSRMLLRRLDDLKEGAESMRESVELNEADFRWQRRVLSAENAAWETSITERSPDISISVTTDTGLTTLEGRLVRPLWKGKWATPLQRILGRDNAYHRRLPAGLQRELARICLNVYETVASQKPRPVRPLPM